MEGGHVIVWLACVGELGLFGVRNKQQCVLKCISVNTNFKLIYLFNGRDFGRCEGGYG
jgi:hypothetical protein